MVQSIKDLAWPGENLSLDPPSAENHSPLLCQATNRCLEIYYSAALRLITEASTYSVSYGGTENPLSTMVHSIFFASVGHILIVPVQRCVS